MASNYTLTMPRRRTSVADGLQRATSQLLAWYARSRERHALAQLDDRMLRDIGIGPAEAHREANKPFWAR